MSLRAWPFLAGSDRGQVGNPLTLGNFLGSVGDQRQVPVSFLAMERCGLFGKFQPSLGHVHQYGFDVGV